jgi:hypothetical protein
MTYMPPFDDYGRRWRRMDRVVRLLIANWALGMGIGAALAVFMLAVDFMGLRTLLWRSDVAVMGTALIIAVFAFTFGGLVAATAAMRAGRDDDDEPRGGRRAPAYAYAHAVARGR